MSPALAGLRTRYMGVWSAAPSARDARLVVLVALLARLLVVVWAGPIFPPADDGKFYHVVAERIAQGLGYTWLWPDGVVTYAAHYPVGYPALVGAFYAIFGSHVWVAMLFNALIGTAGVWAVYRVAAGLRRRGPALFAGLVAALHPGILFYTPALMTEGVTAALLALLAALSTIASERPARAALPPLVATGLLAGVLALVRPQTIVLAPVLGAFALAGSRRARLAGAAVVTALALLVCTPWTLRNCTRLERCVFVSANGGWNLLIGSAEGATGRWVALDVLGVPPECRTVFAEAEKDRCFGRAGVRNITSAPLRFLALVPNKLAATFDWWGAAGHYLNASNGARFPYSRKVTLGVAEAVVERLIVLLGLVAVGRAKGPLRRVRIGLAFFGSFWLFREHAWVAYLALVSGALVGRGRLLARPGVLFGVSVVVATGLTHAVFFGDGRYGLVTGLVLVMLAAEAFQSKDEPTEPASLPGGGGEFRARQPLTE